jgi:hypothetical protein
MGRPVRIVPRLGVERAPQVPGVGHTFEKVTLSGFTSLHKITYTPPGLRSQAVPRLRR